MDQLRKVGKSVKNLCPGGSSGSKKKNSSGRGSTSRFYSRMPEAPPSEFGEIGVGANDMNDLEFQETYGVEEQNEVEVEQNNDDDDDTPTSPAVIIGNAQSRISNLPPRPVIERKKTSLV